MPTTHASMFLWRGRALVVGPGIDSNFHTHFAAQLTIGLAGPFRARMSADSPWIETRGALFAPNRSHQIDCQGELLAHLFVELPQRQRVDISCVPASYVDLPAFAPILAALSDAAVSPPAVPQAERLVHDWLQCALPDVLAPVGFDYRITQAISAIEALVSHSAAETSGAALAANVFLSESRFTHLFRQQTGLPLTRYLLWTRLLAGVEAVARGDNMTAAAHTAGFADLAHMSRTFRQTFGVVPSELRKMTIAFKRDML